MTRPRLGEAGCESANEKWRKTMMAKYGGEEGLRKMQRENGRKGGKNGRGPNYHGGFACFEKGADGLTGRERARIAGSLGGKISRRGPAKDDIDMAEEVLETENGRD